MINNNYFIFPSRFLFIVQNHTKDDSYDYYWMLHASM